MPQPLEAGSHASNESISVETSSTTEEENDAAFDLAEFLQQGILERRSTAGGAAKGLGACFENLTVKGTTSSSSQVRTVPTAILGTFGPDLYHIVTDMIPALRIGSSLTRDLIHDISGTVNAGEMMLVLGRPGAGCSTFLKSIANDRASYAAVQGEVHYGLLSAEQQGKYYRGEVVYNEEDDCHFPTLTVSQTLQFALENKTRKRDRWSIPTILGSFLELLGMPHVKETVVGNEFVRGVSGGERKRVSIAETMATKASVVCWDNSTRGLDANTALEFARALRTMTDISHRTTMVTLYQAGESLYQLMDKVLLIEEGRMLYQGPASEAKAYFEDLGFLCHPRQTTADFLTSVCEASARQFQPGREQSTPKTVAELEKAFRASSHYKRVLENVEAYKMMTKETQTEHHDRFEKTVHSCNKTVSKRSVYTVSFLKQVLTCTKREAWLVWGDKASLATKIFTIVANSLIVGSLFYGKPPDTSSAFTKGSTAFFSIVFLGWLQMTELMPAVSGRPIINRHTQYAFYRPSAVVIARVLLDLLLVLPMTILFGIVVYFLAQLDVEAGKFFIYLLFVYSATICLTALYRMFAALSPTIDDAVRFGGTGKFLRDLLPWFRTLTHSYSIEHYDSLLWPDLIKNSIWFGWLYYLNPIAYGFEALLTNELSNREMECSEADLVPRGPNTSQEYQGCSLPGSRIGSTEVSGADYLASSLSYSRKHLWPAFGVVIAYTVLYILITAIATETFKFSGNGGGALVFKSKGRASVQQPSLKDADLEASEKSPEPTVSKTERIFNFEDVTYEVPYGGGTRRLLNGITGYVKPGSMIALMGSSGAGKTTLLNTLAQRQKTGVVTGKMLVNGSPLPSDFKRMAGFCEQMDLHDESSTILEAFEFSALLRQGRDVSTSEKILNLLELADIQDALISSLTVEQKKRVTIGVELAAKPDLLLFLDEPTSGLDSQAAGSIVRFLRKLCDDGQAIICTIHQPSSQLLEQFDGILALGPGGNTLYNGPVGQNGSVVVQYFAERGFPCPPAKNVAEFVLETAMQPSLLNGKLIHWGDEWRKSDEASRIRKEIETFSVSQPPVVTQQSNFDYAMPTAYQSWLLTRRLFIQYWRDPSYYYSRLFVNVILGIFNGFTFWQLGSSVASMQNRMFTVALIALIPPVIVNSVVPKFYQNRALWETRELPSRIYGYMAFCTANIVCEIPIAIISGTIYWLLWYFPVGFSSSPSTAGYVYLMTIMFSLFQASWGQWICAFAPSYAVVSNLLPFFFVMVNLFNGVFVPYNDFPVFWKYWMYYVNPIMWWIRGVLSATLPGSPVKCTDSELANFNPPPGMTCAEYAGNFVSEIVKAGYLASPNATFDCGYCPYKDGQEYMETLNVKVGEKWKCFGIFLAFTIVNWVLVYFLIYTVRIRRWTFAMGLVFGYIQGLWRFGCRVFNKPEKNDRSVV
ncbi:ABC-2 type transporter-domain-containing protein [Penicillium odoratum]|uniref:ABC-2 type transporter-domain-containing protein n=1 Tax=Penicillium odoratum TaxID=1167516 RepID=UPI002549AA81|nr:ABC-2 type transporter-domain-containing protein [Penicillium odoratum]KAJ5764734.1 ABC-2 type transporter-domain-containing protein [Penicillium odoratum]